MYTQHEGSYFPSQPIIEALPSSDSSSSAQPEEAPHQKHGSRYRRPPTPPFPLSDIPPPRSKSTNDPQAPRHEAKSKSNRQAYSRFLGRLHDEHERNDHRSHSRTRSDSSGSTALPAILRLLAQETARADAAERELARDADALLARVRDAKAAKDRTDSELARVREELTLYKLQLEVAQREINRAQLIVAEVERARVEAEDRGTRDRERVRKLINERAMEMAREEGRREGWKQGLESGRWAAWSSLEESRRTVAYEGRENDQRTHSSQASSSSTSRTRSSSSTSRTDTRGTSRRRNTAPQPALPAPIPIRPNGRRASQGPVHNSAPISALVHPQNISIQARPNSQPRAQSRPASERRAPSPTQTQYSRRTRSPSLAPSHRSQRPVTLPPDGYIPTLGPDALISLPPPHELSQPVEFDSRTEERSGAVGEPVGRGDTMTDGGRESRGDRGPEGERKKPPRAKDYAYQPSSALRSEDVPGYDEVFRARSRGGRTTTAMSATSRGSTRISQYDLVSPPRDHERERDWLRRRNAVNIGERNGSERGRNTPARDRRTEARERTQPEQIVEEWRSANSDVIETPTPSNPRISEGAEQAGSTYSLANPGTTTDGFPTHSGAASSAMMRSPRVSGGPHPPKNSAIHDVPRSSESGYVAPGTYSSNIYQNVDASSHRSQSSQHPPRSASTSNIPPQGSRGTDGRRMDQKPSVHRPRDAFQRSMSSATVIGIAVEPPSRSPTNSSEGTIVDPILLTPDHANRPTPLPHNMVSIPHEASSGIYSGQDHGNKPVTIVWPDNNLPPGFVPLSPIPTLTNFNPDDHDHHRMHEQFRGAGYQIYAGVALVPPVGVAGPAPGHRPSHNPNPSSILFSDIQRASTPTGDSRGPSARETPRRRFMTFDSSPAPLNRPFSIFSDT